MKIVICYFSGTGNTKKVVDYYKSCFEEKDVEVQLVNMEKDAMPDLTNVDYVGFAYPIHSFNAPAIVLKFAKSIKKQSAKVKYFIIKTSGEPLKLNNISSYKLRAILKRRNFSLQNEYHYVMPYNMIFRHTDTMAYKMWQTVKAVAPIDCEEILSGKVVKLPYVFMGNFIAWVMRIEHWGGRFNGKKYKVSDACIGCKACINRCPTHNISLDDEGNFHFGKNCLMCMRCSFFCPKNAIKIGWFNSWKVNGPYTFAEPKEEEVDNHKKFCKKAYDKYFKRCEEKVSANKDAK